jgi:glyoxylate reductase
MKPKILVTQKILSEALAYLNEHAEVEVGTQAGSLAKEEIKTKIRDKEGLLCLLVDEIDRGIIDAAPQLRIIANCAVGFDNIDVSYAQSKGILVANTPGVLTETTADLTWALILALARRIPQADRFTRELKFQGWELELFLGKEIRGKRLGIIGMGRIGKEVALLAAAFRMEVVYHDPRPLSPEEEKKYLAAYLPLDELLRSSDIITLHAALTPQSFHLLSREKLALLKKEAILINAARGPLIDEQALADALEQGRIWGAGLDVYENEPRVEERLLKLDNVVLLPHIGSATYETRLRMAMMASRNLIQGLRGETPDNPVF